jgi:hypothetical protein
VVVDIYYAGHSRYNETAACGNDLLQAAALRRLVLRANSSASGAHTLEMEADSAAKFL